ncbi:hypothetical protein [Xenorhabdus santafensis]|uniref:hypothetical protein n=1 Tax=Xenorhabdus santafensis TaxID=2582833 RepID=UPI0029E81F96|nr:hypothetical protein [Xenorhabdus sp. 12]
MDFKLRRGSKGMTNSSGTNLNSQRLAPGERQEPSIIPGSIDNYVTGVNEHSQQRGSLKDEGDKHTNSAKAGLIMMGNV